MGNGEKEYVFGRISRLFVCWPNTLGYNVLVIDVATGGPIGMFVTDISVYYDGCLSLEGPKRA